MEDQRLFLAIPVPEEVRKEIIVQRNSLGLALKWIPEENLHVTLLFLGNVEENNIPGIVSKLHKLYETTEVFHLEVNTLIQKSNRFQHMLWAGFKPSSAFVKLAVQTAEVLRYKQERKPLPHINLVRSKTRVSSEKIPLKLGEELIFPVKKIELMSSRLSPRGATYTVLESFTLKETQGDD